MKIACWSDYACPYCYIGEKRLESALEELGLKENVEIEMKAFELDPEASREVQSRTDERFAKKYGLTIEGARAQIENISNLGRAEGIDFKYAETQYTNMLDAHRLTKFIASKGRDVQKIIHLLFDAYFTKNLKLAEKSVLITLAKEVGIDESDVNTMLDSQDFIDEVRRDEIEAQSIRIHGVPFFIINNKYAISGAWPKNEIKRILSQALSDQQSDSLSGMVCGLDGCHRR
ncbi:MAG: DsbA family oxidoreductase [Alphaproteobacteria bacterium]|nr:DsbA family oxidoreductase [Alphaproteobacteria bacterium]